MCFHLCRRPPVPHSALLRPPASLLLPCPKGSRIPRRPTSRQGHIYFLFREFAYRLRSKRRHGSAFHRRRPRPNQTQGRRYPRLSQPDHAPIHSHRTARILRGLRHGALAQSRPLFVHSLRPCSPTRTSAARFRPALANPSRGRTEARLFRFLFFHLTHSAPTFRPTGPIAAHSLPLHERRIRSTGIGRAEFITIGDPHPVPTRSRARLFGVFLFSRPFLRLTRSAPILRELSFRAQRGTCCCFSFFQIATSSSLTTRTFIAQHTAHT